MTLLKRAPVKISKMTKFENHVRYKIVRKWFWENL